MPRSIVFVGDSLTAAGRWDEWFPDLAVLNHGVAGDTTDDVIARVDAVVESAPDAVVLLAGTNDVAWRKSVDHIGRNLETIIAELRKRLPDGRILVISVLPREAEHAATIRDVNRHVRQFAATVHAHYLDLWPVLADEDGGLRAEFSEDRLHLLDAGYDAWRRELEPAVRDMLESAPTTRSIPVV
ncbi:MAG: GDSL-type esterase/lipase family protein [Leifsonia sp.]